MEIVEDAQFRAELIEKIRMREFAERTGVHMSDLNFCLNKQMLRKVKPLPDTEQEILLFSVGWASQRWLTSKDVDEPSKEVDGILVTCDSLYEKPLGYDREDGHKYMVYGVPVPWELKATYQSSNRPIEDNVAWIRQIMAQCYTQGVTEAYLTRFELLGDWGSVYPKGKSKHERDANRKASQRPTLHAYKLSFSQGELDRNWEWFKERRTLYVKLLEDQKPLPKVIALPSGGSYECQYCHYTEECNEK